jgi:hypothetical protein
MTLIYVNYVLPRSGVCFGERESHTRPWRSGVMNGCRDGRDACPGGLGGPDYVFRGAEFAGGDALKGAVFGVEGCDSLAAERECCGGACSVGGHDRGQARTKLRRQTEKPDSRRPRAEPAGQFSARRRGGPRHNPECRLPAERVLGDRLRRAARQTASACLLRRPRRTGRERSWPAGRKHERPRGG